MRQRIDLSGYWDGRLELNPEIDVAAPACIEQPFYIPLPWNLQLGDVRWDGSATEMSGIVRPIQNQNFRDIQRKFAEGTITYRKTVDVPSFAELPRVFLVFEGSNYRTAVRVNGHDAGTHDGGHLAFEFELTGRLQEGTNEIEIVVDNLRRKDACPQEQFNWQNYGGIYRAVHIEYRPQVFIRHAAVVPRYQDGRWSADFTVEMSDAFDGKIVADTASGDEHKTVTATEGNRQAFMLTADFESPRVWRPGAGGMSEAVIAARQGEATLDRLEVAFGFRTVTVDGRHVLINGEKTRLLGAALHEQHAAFGNAVPPWQSDIDVKLAKHAGLNAIRAAHYPHAQSFYNACDRHGMMVVAEQPCWQFNKHHFNNPGVRDLCVAHAREMTRQLGHHPSIIGWMIQNESKTFEPGAAEFFGAVNDAFKTSDPSRFTISAEHAQPPEHLAVVKQVKGKPSGDLPPTATIADILGTNNYAGWYAEKSDFLPMLLDHVAGKIKDRPIVLTEFGAEGIPGSRSMTMEPWTEDYQAALLCRHIDAVLERDDMAGFFIWLFADYECASIGIRGINAKGLVGPDRKPKKAFDAVRGLLHDHRSGMASHSAGAGSGSAPS